METQGEDSQSLRSLFQSALKDKTTLESTPADTTSDAYRDKLRATIRTFEECHKRIQHVSLFSPNESLEDINTSDLPYLTVTYHLAELLQKSYDSDRLKSLQRTLDVYSDFLETLNDYELLSKSDQQLFERFSDNPRTFALAPASNPAARREIKIARFQEEKMLKERLEYYRQHSNSLSTDDEVVRKLYLAEIQLYTHQTFQTLDMIAQEASMLAMIAAAGPPQPSGQTGGGEDARKPGLMPPDKLYTERLDVGLAQSLRNAKGPLLDKKGVPLRPFTITDKRTELRQGVFRPGHNLPTMSIDEYLDEERRRGGIIEGGGEASGQPAEVDEDDLEKADEETYKARYWDEFKEENPKGAGNTLNRG